MIDGIHCERVLDNNHQSNSDGQLPVFTVNTQKKQSILKDEQPTLKDEQPTLKDKQQLSKQTPHIRKSNIHTEESSPTSASLPPSAEKAISYT